MERNTGSETFSPRQAKFRAVDGTGGEATVTQEWKVGIDILRLGLVAVEEGEEGEGDDAKVEVGMRFLSMADEVLLTIFL
jgi:hypothetical protein